MKSALLLALAVSTSSFALPYAATSLEVPIASPELFDLMLAPDTYPPQPMIKNIDEIKAMLHEQASTLSQSVIDKTIAALQCSYQHHIDHNAILTIIDYSLPSNEKRLWVFDLMQGKLLFNTYVSHGIKSGSRLTTLFSNKYNSKASSIGLYLTNALYYGREGASLRLSGLDRGFNDNAENRSIVMHGGWYVKEEFIKKYGRPGRSWGCPAVPLDQAQLIINTIKNNSLMVIYYPNDDWFVKSKFLTCSNSPRDYNTEPSRFNFIPSINDDLENHDYVLFVNNHHYRNLTEEAPILVIAADNYQKIFLTPAPLTRMLRRQINNVEFVALTNQELGRIAKTDAVKDIYFVTPTIKMVRGYYETEMKMNHFGKIKSISLIGSATRDNINQYLIQLESNSTLNLISTNRFIRWLGL